MGLSGIGSSDGRESEVVVVVVEVCCSGIGRRVSIGVWRDGGGEGGGLLGRDFEEGGGSIVGMGRN